MEKVALKNAILYEGWSVCRSSLDPVRRAYVKPSATYIAICIYNKCFKNTHIYLDIIFIYIIFIYIYLYIYIHIFI